MTEPLYHYEKGKGWVLGPEGYVFQMEDCQVSIVAKTPVPGDHIITCGVGRRDWINPDGTIVEGKWRDWVSRYRFDDIFHTWGGGVINKDLAYFVVVTL